MPHPGPMARTIKRRAEVLSWEWEACVCKEGVGVSRSDGREEGGDGRVDRLPRTGTEAPEELLALGEGLLDGIAIGRVGRQEQQVAAYGLDELPGPRVLVHAEIIEDHDLAGTQARNEDALDKGGEDPAIYRAIDHQAFAQPVGGQGGNPDDVRPMPTWDMPDGALPFRRTSAQRRQDERGTGLIQEDQVAGIQADLRLPPRLPRGGILFGGDQGLFLSGRSRRRKRRLRCEGL